MNWLVADPGGKGGVAQATAGWFAMGICGLAGTRTRGQVEWAQVFSANPLALLGFRLDGLFVLMVFQTANFTMPLAYRFDQVDGEGLTMQLPRGKILKRRGMRGLASRITFGGR